MYKQYMNDYEKRAEQIRKAARAVESGNLSTTVTQMQPTNITQQEQCTNKKMVQQKEKNETISIFGRLALDDILILALLLLLISSEDKDISMIIILGYLFLTGL